MLLDDRMTLILAQQTGSWHTTRKETVVAATHGMARNKGTAICVAVRQSLPESPELSLLQPAHADVLLLACAENVTQIGHPEPVGTWREVVPCLQAAVAAWRLAPSHLGMITHVAICFVLHKEVCIVNDH
jgi:hypothetical protein